MFWIKFFSTEPAVLIPVVLIVGAVILLRKDGGFPAALQIVGCVAYLAYFSFEIFVGTTAEHSWLNLWRLSVIKFVLGFLIFCYPVGVVWFVIRVPRRT